MRSEDPRQNSKSPQRQLFEGRRRKAIGPPRFGQQPPVLCDSFVVLERQDGHFCMPRRRRVGWILEQRLLQHGPAYQSFMCSVRASGRKRRRVRSRSSCETPLDLVELVSQFIDLLGRVALLFESESLTAILDPLEQWTATCGQCLSLYVRTYSVNEQDAKLELLVGIRCFALHALSFHRASIRFLMRGLSFFSSGLLTLTATESVSLCAPMKS